MGTCQGEEWKAFKTSATAGAHTQQELRGLHGTGQALLLLPVQPGENRCHLSSKQQN